MADGDGLTTAVELTGGSDDEPEPAAVQASLPLTELGGEAPLLDERGAPVAARRGPGRPPGARNKRTEAWVRHILSRYRSPLEFLAETYSRPVGELVLELGCKPAEAFEIQRKAAEGLAPYVHQRQPLAVEVDAKGVVQLVLGDAFGADDDDDEPLPTLPKQNQGVSGSAAGELDGEELDSRPESPENRD